MRLLPGLAAFCLLFLVAIAPARAYTPESGIWWNPNESGSGYVIEIQDNLMVLSYFGGDTQGRATWWLASGLLTGNALFPTATLNRTVGSQCPGCPYNGAPTTLFGDGGTVRVQFDPNDNTRATLTFGNGRVVTIQRQLFYLKRGEDGSVPLEVTRMLGEWQMVMDFSSNTASSFDYYGDVLVLDDYEFADNRWYFVGCRADNSVVGGCSQSALTNHDAAGFYDTASGLHAIVVSDTPQNYLLYLADMGTDSAIGEITVYPKGQNPNNYDAYPMRTFRTASRTFVQEGVGPSKAAPASTDAVAGLSDRLLASGHALQAKANATSKFDRAALAPLIAELEARLEAGRSTK
jgi:hypothetical protein